MRKLLAKPLLFAALAVFASGHCHATGFYGPDEYLSEGGKNVDASPEFYWDLEVKRLARDFHPAEKRSVSKTPDTPAGNDRTPAADVLAETTTGADLEDFDAALKEGRIKPPDPKKATEEHEAARTFLVTADDQTTAALPVEFDSEFADYHRGALAFRTKHWEEARKAWEGLLQRPAGDRHYRSVWAAFMLGKLALKQADPQAPKWFQQTRALAKDGFADSLGMAADSYGWEARSAWKQNHPEKAAPLYLTQLALGDESAVVSLKALIPDREPVDGMLNYGPEPNAQNPPTEQQKRAQNEKTLADLKIAAADPLLRRLVTAHILATASSHDLFSEEAASASERCSRWLSVVKEAKPGKMEDAEYLGWVAYTSGKYEQAQHWLDLAAGDTPAASWLRAKLQRRAGKLDEAAKSMDQAWQSIHDIENYTGSKEGDDYSWYIYRGEGGGWTFSQSASGDLGALRLSRGDFVQAMDTLLKGGLWNDASFVAERVLTADELKTYVDAQPAKPPTAKGSPDGDTTHDLRYLLGRRLVREDRYDDALAYLPPPNDQILRKYLAALKDGADEKKPKLNRARAWFTAAWIARHDGMEIMGTEVAPDGTVTQGDFEDTDIAKQRETGVYTTTRQENGQEKTVKVPIALKPSKQELQRLAKNKIQPDIRYHYRVIAAALALRAAQFMDDNTEALADVVNTAGLWVKDRDNPAADRYYAILKKRCAATKIGRAAIAKHWFVEDSGPWSQEQDTAETAMHDKFDADKPPPAPPAQ